ncbi:MAG: hypothetical protein KGR46_08000, partial [Verrucomicrobia bacterium]|nr:hypothetical protein [Verrucomicrobiota bacterium]
RHGEKEKPESREAWLIPACRHSPGKIETLASPLAEVPFFPRLIRKANRSRDPKPPATRLLATRHSRSTAPVPHYEFASLAASRLALGLPSAGYPAGPHQAAKVRISIKYLRAAVPP